jgi:hypothetical protein
MTALARVAGVLAQARVAGGWDDEAVARAVLAELGLGDDGYPVQPPADVSGATDADGNPEPLPTE